MAKVRLAGTMKGEKDPNREIRARLLYELFSKSWDIYNSNGDQRITLSNIEKYDYLQDGYTLGKLLAENRFGCVSGAGKSGIMGEVVRGSVEAGGWAGGSNVPHIIELEGLPAGLSSFWLKPDIYTHMKIMIERSDAFVIFPGGAGKGISRSSTNSMRSSPR